MKILVQKFGGTSVATEESRQHVYGKIRAAMDEDFKLVVVVSAMGRLGDPYATESLLSFFARGQALPNNREQDMVFAVGEIISGATIARELSILGEKTVFLTGQQAGIVSNGVFSEAKILSIDPNCILKWLSEGYLVLVAGGQAADCQGNITSLGRGGSDITACALGHYLEAEQVQIFTDVPGILTGDPRVVEGARLISQLGYEDCKLLAELGAKVIHPEAVTFSQRRKKNLLSVRSTFMEGEGTRIGDYDTAGTFSITGSRGQYVLSVPMGEHLEYEGAFKHEEPRIPRFTGQDNSLYLFRYDPVEKFDLKKASDKSERYDLVFVVGDRAGIDMAPIVENKALFSGGPYLSGNAALMLVREGSLEEAMNHLHRHLVLGGKP